MMSSSHRSRRTVFRQIAQQSYVEWPTYESSPLFDRSSLPALESDVRLVAEMWFSQDNHVAIEPFVHAMPLAYVQFDAHTGEQRGNPRLQPWEEARQMRSRPPRSGRPGFRNPYVYRV